MSSTLVRDKPAASHNGSLKVFTRALQQLVRSAPGALAMPKAVIQNALAHSTSVQLHDTDALSDHVVAIVDLFAGETKPGAQRRKSALGAMKQLVRAGALLPAADFVASWGVTRQALSKAIAAHRVFYVEIEGDRYFPAFFVDLTYDRHQLEQVSKCLGELAGASKLQFFTSKKASLGGRTPLQALAQGKFSAVRNAAAGFAER